MDPELSALAPGRPQVGHFFFGDFGGCWKKKCLSKKGKKNNLVILLKTKTVEIAIF